MVESAGSVAVVGAGIIGISTALEIQALIPGAQVTIFSEDVSPDTTADGAAGIFGLYLMGATPTEDQVRWAQITHDWMERLWKTPNGGKLGLALVSSTRLTTLQFRLPGRTWSLACALCPRKNSVHTADLRVDTSLVLRWSPSLQNL